MSDKTGNKAGNKVGNKNAIAGSKKAALTKTQVRILAEIRNNPNITKARIMEKLEVGKTTVDTLLSPESYYHTEKKEVAMLNEIFKAVVDADQEPIVICDTEHRIIYRNPVAVKRYEKRGGKSLLGKSIFDCHNSHSREVILSVYKSFCDNPDLTRVYTYSLKRDGEDKDVYMIALRNDSGELIGYYEKHESRLREGEKSGICQVKS